MSSKTKTTQDRYKQGLEALEKISGTSGERVVNSFKDIAPDLGRYIIEFSYGDIFSRPGLDLKTRELSAVAALTAMDKVGIQVALNVHINAALNVGATQQEIVEIMMNMLPYAGFPSVQNGINVARVVFQEREKKQS
ncbi:4-carboxymuconolactone decarboxylase [Nostocales cyanobacterium HT-58-2]|nr:4-carboxymuconolactone decarboxylase [Nostocales cyanobacterium HT-58-2]